jgi:superfamily II DNA or RNA helicase
MINLRPYQQELLDVLVNPARPRFGLIESVPGAGISAVVELYIRKVAAESRVLVLCAMRVQVDQWAERLRADENLRVIVLDSASSSLELLDGQAVGAGVLVATYARTRHGLSGRALAQLDFGLILHDQPSLPFSGEVSLLNSRAREAIALRPLGRTGDATLSWPTLWSMTPTEHSPENRLSPIKIPVHSTPVERALRDEGIGLLREDAERRGRPLILPSDSLPALHARLLGVASDSHEPSDFAKRVWQLLDRMEGSFARDSRLVALDEFLTKAADEGRRCVVVTAVAKDASYIADHYAEVGRKPQAVISGVMRTADRRAALTGLRAGEFLVATQVLTESRDDWPAGVTVILWPSPVNRRVLDQLAWIAESSQGLTVAEISEL